MVGDNVFMFGFGLLFGFVLEDTWIFGVLVMFGGGALFCVMELLRLWGVCGLFVLGNSERVEVISVGWVGYSGIYFICGWRGWGVGKRVRCK